MGEICGMVALLFLVTRCFAVMVSSLCSVFDLGGLTCFSGHPTFRVMRQSCSAYSLSLKYRSSLNHMHCVLLPLFYCSSLRLYLFRYDNHTMAVFLFCKPIWGMFIFCSCGILLSIAWFAQSDKTFSTSSLHACAHIPLNCSFG